MLYTIFAFVDSGVVATMVNADHRSFFTFDESNDSVRWSQKPVFPHPFAGQGKRKLNGFDSKYLHQVVDVPSGHSLSHGDPPRSRTHTRLLHSRKPRVDFDTNGKIAWTLTNDDLPGNWLQDPCGGQVLPNGNIVITSHAAGRAAPHASKLFEVTPEKKLAWKYADGQNLEFSASKLSHPTERT